MHALSTLMILATGAAAAAIGTPDSAPVLPTVNNGAAISMMNSSIAPWTVRSLRRPCNQQQTLCVWQFAIDENRGGVGEGLTGCQFSVTSNPPVVPASHINGGPAPCGPFTITTGWSGQFGDANGFTVVSIADYARNLIIYAGYPDSVLANGTVVTPDQTYQPQKINA